MNGWEKFKVVSAVFIPAVIALVGHWYTSAISEREVQAKFVELGVSILQTQPREGTSNLRGWATDVLNKYSGVPINQATRQDLINRVPFPSTNKILLREGSLPVGKEWDENNSRAYLKFESYKDKEVVVTYDISYDSTEIKTLYFQGQQILTFKGEDSIYELILGPYNENKKTLSVSVYKIL